MTTAPTPERTHRPKGLGEQEPTTDMQVVSGCVDHSLVAVDVKLLPRPDVL